MNHAPKSMFSCQKVSQTGMRREPDVICGCHHVVACCLSQPTYCFISVGLDKEETRSIPDPNGMPCRDLAVSKPSRPHLCYWNFDLRSIFLLGLFLCFMAWYVHLYIVSFFYF